MLNAEPRYLDDIPKASKLLSNKEFMLRDKRDEDNQPIPNTLFQVIARSLTSAFQGFQTERKVFIDIEKTNSNKMYADVVLFVKETPNILNYLSNAMESTHFMGATVKSPHHTFPKKIPDGWMRVEYRFYPPEPNWAIKEDLHHNLPPLDMEDDDTEPVTISEP